MDDVDGPLVAFMVYDKTVGGTDLSRIPYALDDAVKLLQGKANAERWATYAHLGI